MPQSCVAFDYFGRGCRLREAVRVEGNSVRGCRVALGPLDKAGAHIFRAPKSNYNHCVTQCHETQAYTSHLS